jgi:hypothetical protein
MLGYDETEEARILDRLRRFEKIHVARPAGQQAVVNLKREGKVAYHVEDGVMVVYRPGVRPLLGGGGGDAA